MSDSKFTPTEIRKTLHSAAKILVPSFRNREEPPTPREKIAEMEDHLFLIARWRGVLEEARLFMFEAVKELEDQWDAIEGWEAIRGSKDKTKQSMVDAKRTIRPDVYDGIREGKFLIARLSEQIRRFERDEEQTISRGYTLLSGG